jgi:hypothetical protein
MTGRTGIGVAADRTTVTNNMIRGRFIFDASALNPAQADQTYSSIAIYKHHFEEMRSDCIVSGNHCLNTRGYGVLVADRVDGLIVSDNFIRETAGGGIVALDKAHSSRLTIDRNDIRSVGRGHDKPFGRCYGIRLAVLCDADIVENTIDGVGLADRDGRPHLPANGIHCDAPRRVRIDQNRISNVMPTSEIEPRADGTGGQLCSAAIRVIPPFGVVEITNNLIQTTGILTSNQKLANGHTFAIRIEAPRVFDFTVFEVPFNVESVERIAGGEPPDGQQLAISGTGHQHVFTFGVGGAAVSLGLAAMLVLIRSNVIESEGDVDQSLGMVLVSEPKARITFGGNICAQRFIKDQLLRYGVRLNGETIVADSNQIFGRFTFAALDVGDSLGLQLWTIVGNIAQRGIVVSGSPLTGPWLPLNRMPV